MVDSDYWGTPNGEAAANPSLARDHGYRQNMLFGVE